ncbi:WD40 repeat domain-containing protein [Cryptosporangium arvum]|uniref:Periplasmic component of the Tol biopolymer transport system n=1 Tax=Cryptosporangium arvum DSM 44712 TaxID=927661 RepID=A0A010ZQ17_9ACTN|nr:hypothetical protein [Cryptosporangium arvum]EXG79282.1 hypothetical protein CryarDRAFT_0314 [Cryptosporangium arvum DSM 44712]
MIDVYAPAEVPRCPDWTMSWDADPPGRAAFAVDDGEQTLLLAADGRRIRMVGAERLEDPGQLSPDGTRLALVVDRPVPTVSVLDLRDGSRRGFPATVRGAEVLSWLPSGRRLLYGNDEGMYLLDLETGRSDAYDLSGEEPREVAVAPEGARIAVDVGAYVRIAPLAGGPPVRVPLPEDAALGAHGWSPDGRLLAVGREITPSRDQRGGFDLVVTALDTERGFRPAAQVSVVGVVAGAFVGWRSMSSILLLERRFEEPFRLVVRGLDGSEIETLAHLHGSVWEVRAAAGLLEVVRTNADGEPVDLGVPPRWQRMTGAMKKGFRKDRTSP